MNANSPRYIHGYSLAEQRRLIEQARVLAANLHAGLELRASRRVLELGCGVGAELGYLQSQAPWLRLTGIDCHAGHLQAAAGYLNARPGGRAPSLIQADAAALPFAAASFDTVMTVWMLEHVRQPAAVLAEALRVLTPDGRLICTEVDNATLRLEPALPAIEAWLEDFNRFQQEAGGDPYVGRRLVDLARALGAREIGSETLPILSTQFEPQRRPELIDYLESLLLSGAEALLAAGRVGATRIAALRDDFATLRASPERQLRYFAVRLTCCPGLSNRPIPEVLHA